MNPVTQAVSAAHAIAARAAAEARLHHSLLSEISDTDKPQPALDAALDELSGDELLLLALAADVLAQRARVTEQRRRAAVFTAEINKLRK